jgi:hypothetical protein
MMLETLHLEVGVRKSRRAQMVRESQKEIHIGRILEAEADVILGEDIVHIREMQKDFV